jgi:hypothetical protein
MADRLRAIEELEGRIAALRRELAEVEGLPDAPEEREPEREPEPARRPATPEEERIAFAEALRDRLNASTSTWYEVGADDAA